MFSEIKVFEGENPNVKKYVFIKEDICIEAVLYKYGSYEKRTVMCVSVQSGCPVGCVFCGTGKKFVRNLTHKEIKYQVDYIVSEVEKEMQYSLNSSCEKFQIMFMSMGEPMLNWDNVVLAIYNINLDYRNASLLLSTIGVNNTVVFEDICRISKQIDKVGLQFSLHSAFDGERDLIIPFSRKMSIRDIRDAGIMWNSYTHRPVYLNICVDSIHPSFGEVERMMDLFPASVFNFTFSIICEYENGKPQSKNKQMAFENKVKDLMVSFIMAGYNVRAFDPAGQDDIGAGCGQLWYTQEWMKNHQGECSDET